MVVIDTSVAYKWFGTEKEDHITHALKLLKDHLHKKQIVIAPDIILYELSNAWATKTKLSIEHINTFLEDLEEIRIQIEFATYELIKKAAEFSKKYNISVYDASYLVLAREKKCDFITADSKLVEKINLPFIKHIRQVPT